MVFEKGHKYGVAGDHDRAVEIGRLGGLATVEKSWGHQQYCTKDCVHYSRCSAITASLMLDLAEYKWDKSNSQWVKCERRELSKTDRKRYPCFIKIQAPEIQNDFKNLYEEGEEGLIRVLLDMFLRYTMRMRSGKVTTKELRESIEVALKIKTGVYGDTQKIEHSGGLGVIIIDDVPRKITETVIEENDTSPKT